MLFYIFNCHHRGFVDGSSGNLYNISIDRLVMNGFECCAYSTRKSVGVINVIRVLPRTIGFVGGAWA